MVSVFYDNFLLSDQDINRFFVLMEIGLNPKFLIQLSEILSIELTGNYFILIH